MQSRPSNGAKELVEIDLSKLEVHFPSANPIPALENVLTGLQSKKLFTADMSSLGKEQSAEKIMKHLVSTMASRDSKEELMKLFEVTSGLGITFRNLPEVSIMMTISYTLVITLFLYHYCNRNSMHCIGPLKGRQQQVYNLQL